MRRFIFALLICGVAACGPAKDEAKQPQAPVVPAALSFEGADYKDEAAKIAHGKRLAIVHDCTGCHGANLQGANVTADDPKYGDMNAPNITLLLAEYSDSDFARLMRQGVPKDGREFWFMPVESLQFLSDADLAAIVAYLRTFKPAGKQLPPIRKGKGFYEDLDRGFEDSTKQVQRFREQQPVGMGESHAWGRYLTQVTCAGCHNGELQGYSGFTPNLDIAGAYSQDELKRLLTTGEGKVKKDLGMMSQMARDHFSKMTPRERDAVVGYVLARAHRAQ